MTLDQLKYFYEAAKLQHVGKAARIVHISPSAISSAIASLEEELGCKLFDRRGKAIVLTDSGRILRSEVERLLDQVSGMKRTLQGVVGQLRGSYRLGASHFLASHILSPGWSRIQNGHPELVGEICSLPTAQVMRELISGALDVGLCFSPFRHPDLEQIDLHRGRLSVVVRSGHPLIRSNDKSALKKLSSFPAAIHKDQPGVDLCEVHPIFAKYDIQPRISFLFDSDECAVKKILSSDAWAMVPDVVVKAFSKQIQPIKLPMDWDATYSVAILFRKGRGKNPVIQEILREAKRLLGGYGTLKGK